MRLLLSVLPARRHIRTGLVQMPQGVASEPIGRIHNQPVTPASAAQSEVTSITVRSARSNAAVAPPGTAARPARTAFKALLACAGAIPARGREKPANSTRPHPATANKPATPRNALLT